MTDVIAAPSTPSPSPKISSGSQTAVISPPESVTYMARLASPAARNTPEHAMPMPISGVVGSTIRRKRQAISWVRPLAPNSERAAEHLAQVDRFAAVGQRLVEVAERAQHHGKAKKRGDAQVQRIERRPPRARIAAVQGEGFGKLLPSRRQVTELIRRVAQRSVAGAQAIELPLPPARRRGVARPDPGPRRTRRGK